MDKLESTFHKTQNNNHNTIKARRKWPRNGKWRTANGNCSSNYNNYSNLSISLWANFKIIAHSRRRKLSAMMCIICNLYRHTHTHIQTTAGRLQSRRSQLRRRLRAAFHSLRPTRNPHLDFMSSFVDTIVAIVVILAVLIIVLLCPHTHIQI